MPSAIQTMAEVAARPRRKADTGLQRPYRRAPDDFVETYLRFGQTKELEEYHRANWRCVIRWIEECGGDELRAARSRITGQPVRPYKRSDRARRYVLGLRLTAVKHHRTEE